MSRNVGSWSMLATLLFVIQHLAGFFLFPEFVFGSSTYTFSMVMIHAFFLLATAGASVWITLNKQKNSEELQDELRKMISSMK